MALSEAFVDAHIAHWTQQLTSAFFPHRRHWPSCLFHHAPLENALAILNDGSLRSRTDEQNCRPRDVAAPGVIDARHYAHDRVRLYFRPKTPTQYSIEGIRKPGECRYGDETHLPVIVMFCLDAKQVLLRPDIQFSNKNMQLGDARVGTTEKDFSAIEFAKVYHEGSIGDNRSIIDTRCAEVLPSSPLPLNECVKAIYFRSDPERDTLLHLLGERRSNWSSICHVSDELKVFQKEYAFVNYVELTTEGLLFRLNPRRDQLGIDVDIRLEDRSGEVVFSGQYHGLPAKPRDGGQWIVKLKLVKGRYLARILLEGHLAFESYLTLEDELI